MSDIGDILKEAIDDAWRAKIQLCIRQSEGDWYALVEYLELAMQGEEGGE